MVMPEKLVVGKSKAGVAVIAVPKAPPSMGVMETPVMTNRRDVFVGSTAMPVGAVARVATVVTTPAVSILRIFLLPVSAT